MINRDAVLRAIYRAVDAENAGLDAAHQLRPSPDTALYGPGSQLDSLRLVTLIAAVEREVEDDLGVSVVLADERAMSQRRSPFLSIGTLADYITQLAAETAGGATP